MAIGASKMNGAVYFWKRSGTTWSDLGYGDITQSSNGAPSRVRCNRDCPLQLLI